MGFLPGTVGHVNQRKFTGNSAGVLCRDRISDHSDPEYLFKNTLRKQRQCVSTKKRAVLLIGVTRQCFLPRQKLGRFTTCDKKIGHRTSSFLS